MPRVKRGTIAHKKRERILKHTKGFRWGRKSKERAAKEALLHAWTHAFRGRKEKKRDFRRLWQTKINAAVRSLSIRSSAEAHSKPSGQVEGLTYNKFIHQLKEKNINLDRKILADLAEKNQEIFIAIVAELNK